jgi:hypothetical protein
MGIADAKSEIKFDTIYRDVWVEAGDLCSRIYAGTGAIEGKSMVRTHIYMYIHTHTHADKRRWKECSTYDTEQSYGFE